MKLCCKCNTTQDLFCFNKDKNKPDGLSSTCRNCRKKYVASKERKEARRLTRPKKLTIKNCKCCHNNFELSHKQGDAARIICYDCENNFNEKGISLSYSVGQMLANARKRAKELNIPFTITVDEVYPKVPLTGICPVLNTLMVRGTRYTMSIDQINPRKGYTADNIQVISLKANMMKCDATSEELMLFKEYIEREYGTSKEN
jgi:hypothetical protein